MKHSERSVIIIGAVLLLAAAFFTISIMSHFVQFGTERGSGLIFLSIGTILFSVYGFSCLLIPVFLFVSAIVLFLPKWESKKAALLGVSILPFFTVVVMERVCSILLPGSTTPVFLVKLFAVLAIGLILIAIEYLSAAVIFDALCEMKVAPKKEVFAKHDAHQKDSSIENELKADDEILISELEEKESRSSYAQFDPVSIIDPKKEKSHFAVDENLKNIDEIKTVEISEYLNQASDENIIEELEVLEDETIETIQDKIAIQEAIKRDKVYEDNNNDLEAELFNETTAFGGHDGISSSIINLEDTATDEFTISNFSVESPDFGFPQDNDQSQEDEKLNENEPILLEFNDPDLSILDIAAMQKENLVNMDEEDFLTDPFDQINENLEDDFDVEENDDDEEIDYESILFGGELEDEYEGSEAVTSDCAIQSVASKPKKECIKRPKKYFIPTTDILTNYPDGEYWIIDKETQDAATLLKETLSEFRIQAEVTGIRKGPVITMFEILPAPGVKLSKIVALQDNIALRLAASSVRIVAPIPGKSAVGIEVPNRERAIVSFKELIETEHPAYKKMSIPVILGKDITGEGQFLDLTKTPHLLIAGSTGSGKSVCVNTMILSILYKRSPQEVKMILIDPKVVELKLYNDIPHLLTPVITEPKKAFQALQYCLCEMERRYALLDGMGVREINSYNKRIIERNIATEKLPYIVVVIDEFADLMATTGKELESTVARLAAMSRAVGIHLVLATQRPSIDVITGLIKANIPTRIAFMVASKMDSRIIIDQMGAEKLLGKGDMLYSSATDPFPIRIQGTFVSDTEVENVVEYVKKYGPPEYIDEEIFVEDDDDTSLSPSLFGGGEDPLYDKALEIVIQAGKASASYIQRRLKIGYNRAARLVEDMESRGIVGPPNGSKPREIVHVP